MPQRKLKQNWILSYSDAIDKFSEAPTAYNVWCAISVISAVLKRHVWLNRGHYKIYPNQYIVLVGPPGVGKGSAIHPAHAFVKESKPNLANYFSDRITAPKIVEKLASGFQQPVITAAGALGTSNEASAIIQAAELSTFLGSSDWMLSFLCDTWDRGEFEYDTKGKGTHLVKDMCVSLIGGCVPDFIRELNKDSGRAISGGFTARTLFIFATEKSKSVVWPMGFDASAAGKQLKQDLFDDLQTISLIRGEYNWTKTAQVYFERAYHAIKVQDDDSDVVRHFKARQHVHYMKVAMCLAASSYDQLVIDDYAITTAISLVDNVLSTLDITFRGVGESPLAEATARLQMCIEKKGIISRAQLIKDNWRHVTTEDLDRIIYTLIAIGFTKEETIGGKLHYRHLSQKSIKP